MLYFYEWSQYWCALCVEVCAVTRARYGGQQWGWQVATAAVVPPAMTTSRWWATASQECPFPSPYPMTLFSLALRSTLMKGKYCSGVKCKQWRGGRYCTIPFLSICNDVSRHKSMQTHLSVHHFSPDSNIQWASYPIQKLNHIPSYSETSELPIRPCHNWRVRQPGL